MLGEVLGGPVVEPGVELVDDQAVLLDGVQPDRVPARAHGSGSAGAVFRGSALAPWGGGWARGRRLARLGRAGDARVPAEVGQEGAAQRHTHRAVPLREAYQHTEQAALDAPGEVGEKEEKEGERRTMKVSAGPPFRLMGDMLQPWTSEEV